MLGGLCLKPATWQAEEFGQQLISVNVYAMQRIGENPDGTIARMGSTQNNGWFFNRPLQNVTYIAEQNDECQTGFGRRYFRLLY